MITTADKIKICFVCFIFICFGSLMFLFGLYPQSIEIKHFDNRTDAFINKKTIWLFHTKDSSQRITNVKQAKVVSFKDSKRRDVYGIAIISYDGSSTPIFSFGTFLSPKEKLRDDINNAINNKLNYKYTDNEDSGQSVTLGLFLMIMPLLIMLLALFNGFKEITIDFRKTSNTKQENSDDKYNNTIIK